MTPNDLPDTRDGLGLTPDANGNVAPLVWDQNWTPVNVAEYSPDDRLDLFFAAEQNWILPFDQDPDLLAAIGQDNISYWPLPVVGGGPTPPILVQLRQIRVGDAIVLLQRLGITQLNTTLANGQTYTVQLDDSLEVPTFDGHIFSIPFMP